MSKVKVEACSNVALLKYWGRRDEKLRLPANNSVSLSLSGLVTETEISELENDEFVFEGKVVVGKDKKRVFEFLDLLGGVGRQRCRVVSENSFPSKTGLSSSASGFAALSLAGNEFFGLGLSEKELSVVARKGSGSASRSIPGGVVRWVASDRDEESFSETIFSADYWDLRVLAVVVSDGVKEVPTSGGHELAWTSPYFKRRLEVIEEREKELIGAIKKRDFEKFSFCVEREMMEFHAIPMTSKPSLLYWYPGTVEVIALVRSLRKEGLGVCSTVNTGHNVFVVVLPEDEEEVVKKLRGLKVVKEVIKNRIGDGTKVL